MRAEEVSGICFLDAGDAAEVLLELTGLPEVRFPEDTLEDRIDELIEVYGTYPPYSWSPN